MTATHWIELAEQIVRQLEVTAGSRLSIAANDAAALPATHALIEAATRAGAQVQTVYTAEQTEAAMLAALPPEELARPAPIEQAALEWSDVHVAFRAMLWPDPDRPRPPLAELPTRLAALRAAKGTLSALRWQSTRWAVVRIPTVDWAERIGVPYETLLDEFRAGALADWAADRARWTPVADALTVGRQVRITSPDTDLVLGIAGRTGVLFAGEANLPDGEVATAPVDDEVDGHITFPGRSVFAGELFEDLRLEFERGRVVQVGATSGAEVARALISTDDGACRVGELGIGLSTAIRHWTGDLFFDEKILGTVHIALGRAYPQCGGVNESSLHWDIVKDLRECGSLTIDGQSVSGLFRAE